MPKREDDYKMQINATVDRVVMLRCSLHSFSNRLLFATSTDVGRPPVIRMEGEGQLAAIRWIAAGLFFFWAGLRDEG